MPSSTEPTSGRPALLLAGRPFDFSDEPFDGFVARRLRTVALLQRHYNVAILLLRPAHDTAQVHPDLRARVVADVAIPAVDDARSARIRNLIVRRDGHGFGLDYVSAVNRVIRALDPRGAVTFGPWLELEFGPVFAAVPTVHFYEEQLTRMPEIAPQSAQARFLRAAQTRADARREPSPRATVVIAPSELAPAARRFPRAELQWYPYLVGAEQYPVAAEPSRGEEVLITGQLGQLRNAEGLAAVLAELTARGESPPLVAVSQSPLHAVLEPYVDSGLLRFDGFAADMYARYRTAALTLVPAQRSTGIKTTVLQAWAAGTPVVCFSGTAQAFGDVAGDALAVGDSPAQVADLVLAVSGDAEQRRRLAAAGADRLGRYFDPQERDRALLELVAGTLSTAARTDA